jgi:hypothetical protein
MAEGMRFISRLIDVPSMTNLEDDHDYPVVVDLVDDAILTDPNPVDVVVSL